ncbi:MAG: PEP/pyruvate-binding domain-containing protein [Candidatus Diapherotrites archaeon]
MPFVKPFTRIDRHDTPIAGGKGASLGEMTQAKIPVPLGFVVLSFAFDRYISEKGIKADIDSILHKVNHLEMESVERASEKIQSLILTQTLPVDLQEEILSHFNELNSPFVAVRSSATAEDSSSAAWAGQLDTFLNTTKDKLLENMKKCWASLFTSRAIFYRFEKGLHDATISVAVVVQKMVESEVSGIAFSVHPVTQDYNQMVIEAGLGLGEAIVSGQITPDSYVLEKKPFGILDKNVSEQKKGIFRLENGGNEWKEISSEKGSLQKLDDTQIQELGRLILKIEAHYGFPVDVEWALEKGVFYITQSRPITTLSKVLDNTNSKIFLTKTFSRERPLFYFYLWNESDRVSFKDFFDFQLSNNLFVFDGTSTSVWYDSEEMRVLKEKMVGVLNADPTVLNRLTSRLDTEWGTLKPWLSGEKQLEAIHDFEAYYHSLMMWWSAMKVMFYAPNLPNMSQQIIAEATKRRALFERYSDRMSDIWMEFWPKKFGAYSELSSILTPAEAIKLAEEGLEKKVVARIRKRLAGYALLNGNLYLGDELSSELEKRGLFLYEEKVAENLKEIKGQPAYKGKVTGKVRIIQSKDKLNLFQEGEILVTEMTHPDFVPVMRMARAIITDEGGITSHAAIVARELNKPCIIGTNVATKILKDGDEIIVDADKGIVTIIKKANR